MTHQAVAYAWAGLGGSNRLERESFLYNNDVITEGSIISNQLSQEMDRDSILVLNFLQNYQNFPQSIVFRPNALKFNAGLVHSLWK